MNWTIVERGCANLVWWLYPELNSDIVPLRWVSEAHNVSTVMWLWPEMIGPILGTISQQWAKWDQNVSTRVVNCPTRQSLLLSIGSLHWLSSWRWWPSIGGGKIVSATLEARNGRFDPFFLQISQIIYLQMENFVFAILYLVYFALKYMYFEDLSRISENGGYL